MKENKKQWVEPTLLVLVRNRPEEATLDTCKTMNNGGSGYEAVRRRYKQHKIEPAARRDYFKQEGSKRAAYHYKCCRLPACIYVYADSFFN